MKRVKIGLGVFWAATLIGGFFSGTVHAQVPHTVWEGAWFKINVAVYKPNLGRTPNWLPNNAHFTAFLHIGTWTDPPGSIEGDETFDAAIHYNNDTGWQIMPVTLNRIHCIHGNPLDIIISSNNITADVATGQETIRFMARIRGKINKAGTSLRTGTFKSLEGSHPKLDPLVMTGDLIIPTTFCNSNTNQKYPPCWP